VLRLGGQLRASDGRVIGYDLGAALSLASALGICRIAVAEFLPEIERVVVSRINERAETGGGREVEL